MRPSMLGTWDAQNAPGGEKVNNCNENGIEISWQMHFCVAMPNFQPSTTWVVKANRTDSGLTLTDLSQIYAVKWQRVHRASSSIIWNMSAATSVLQCCYGELWHLTSTYLFKDSASSIYLLFSFNEYWKIFNPESKPVIRAGWREFAMYAMGLETTAYPHGGSLLGFAGHRRWPHPHRVGCILDDSHSDFIYFHPEEVLSQSFPLACMTV